MNTDKGKMKLLTTALLLGLFSTGICYAAETLTVQQKEAQEWFEKAVKIDTLALKIEYYTKAIEINPQFAQAYYNRGVAYDNLGQYQKAIDDFNKVIEINPKDALTYYNRGVAYGKLGQYQEANDDFYQAGILFFK